MATILIVDDEYMTVEMLRTFLKIIGHASIEALTARQVWDRLSGETPDAILLDIMMPDVNGIELCRDLRANELTARTPILMISAHAPPMLEAARDAGANAYLIKPITLTTLKNALSEVGVTVGTV
jgi:CheY-like chemotaxis protein